ncbi:MAG: hypothetical protein CMJ18_06500 [Phycisphaeraceae bacterium]|nr:hypothetical protein [Phycisphaeraceae bacterium]
MRQSIETQCEDSDDVAEGRVTSVSVRRTIRWRLLLACAVSFAISGCVQPWSPIGLDLEQAIAPLEASAEAESTLDEAVVDYERRETATTAPDDHRLGLEQCLLLAVHRNRQLKELTYATQRTGLERDIARHELDQPALTATYSIEEGPDATRGSARTSAIGRYGGFEVEPFVAFQYDEGDGDEDYTTYGLAVSRNLIRLRYEDLRQHLPLSEATRDFHAAVNNRLLELRRLHLRVVETFYDIQRLDSRIRVRRNRVADARKFLEAVTRRVREGLSAAVEQTNARISLNQAESDLVREQTNRQNSVDTLLEIIGLDLGGEVEFTDVDVAEVPQVELDLEGDIELVRRRHERVLNQMLAMELQRQRYLISREGVSPDLTATFTAQQFERRDVDNDDDRGDVGLTLDLRVPLDNFRAERAELSQNRLRLMESRVELESIRVDLERRLRRQHRTIRQLETTVALAEVRRHEEHRKLEATVKVFNESGRVSNLEVTRAKEAFDRAEVDLLDARIDRIIEEARYVANLPVPWVNPPQE